MSIVVIITICSHCHSFFASTRTANPGGTSMRMKDEFLVGVEKERNAWKIGKIFRTTILDMREQNALYCIV